MTVTEFRSRVKAKALVSVATEAQLIAVWGPIGSTGKSTVAFNLAYELAALGKRVLLLDLDTHAPALTTLLGIKEVPAGLTGAARLIRQGRFSPEELDRLSVSIKHKSATLRLLPGLSTPVRWPEVTADTIQQLFNIAKQNFDVIITDLASPMEENLSLPEHSTARNAVTRIAIQLADQVLVIIRGSQLSLARYLNNFSALDELQKTRKLIVNQTEPNKTFSGAIRNLTKERIAMTIPEDQATLQLAESENIPLVLARRKSPARNAIAALAHKLLEWPSVS